MSPLELFTLLAVAGGSAGLTLVAVRRSMHRDLTDLAAQVTAWQSADSTTLRLAAATSPSGLSTDEAMRTLVTALHELARAYVRRGETLDTERPWRRQLVDALAQPALLFSPEGLLLDANEAAHELTGTEAGARMDARGDLTVVGALGSSTLAEAVRRVRADGVPLTVDVEREGRDLRASVSLVGDETLLVIADRTRERRIEDVRRNFVVNASHELKTPVTAIQTLAEALELTIGTDTDRAAGLAKRLTGEAERLARLVNDLLDLRRLEERGPLERVPVDLAEVVRQVVADLIPRAEQRDIAMAVEVPEAARIAAIPADVEAIVKNLVTNAVKYNRDGGSVTVGLRTVDGSQVLTVKDTGIGIPHQDHARVFERFYRIDTARSRATGGTGLGLSIVRNAVERHGGSVRVESLLGEGTTFTVVLPIDAG
jgi:signal transduction histidine kinase